MKPIIRVENLSKQYRLGTERASYGTLRDSLANAVTAPFRRFNNSRNPKPGTRNSETIWALKDINFEVRPGEVVGIIGRNGAGKSTLLKILSRITEPTEGGVDLYGRVGSLLEVGTGFHPELTGRENIYLNGAILGLRRKEIADKFEEIAAFAEIEKFLDTPVKHYSSGMYVRLAFAVAAHLDPEILVVDEVLAVGDAEFQQKCLGKMRDIANKDGRTVLFVSHNMATVRNLCSRCIVLQQGGIIFEGAVDKALALYAGSSTVKPRAIFSANKNVPTITRVEVVIEALKKGDLVVEIDFVSPFPLTPPVPGIVLTSLSGIPVFGSNPRFHCYNYQERSLERGSLTLSAKQIPISSGRYHLSVWLGDWQTDYEYKQNIITFDFENFSGTSNRPSSDVIGYLDWQSEWRTDGLPKLY